MKLDIKSLSEEKKVELLKELVDEMDIIVTACYGAVEPIGSGEIFLALMDDSDYLIEKGKTVIISTSIMTG